MATAVSAVSPETMMPGTYIAPIKRNMATVEIVPADTHRLWEIRVRRLDTAVLPKLIAVRVSSRIDRREAGRVNAFIASCFVALGWIQGQPFPFIGTGHADKKSTTAIRCNKTRCSPFPEHRIFGWRPCMGHMLPEPARGSGMVRYGHKKSPVLSSNDRCPAG